MSAIGDPAADHRPRALLLLVVSAPHDVLEPLLLFVSCRAWLAAGEKKKTGGVLSHINAAVQQTPEMLEEASGCTAEEVRVT